VDGYGAVVISYRHLIWLYVFQSNMYPPQEPKLILNASEELSIEGGGKVILLKGVSLREAIMEIEVRLSEVLDTIPAFSPRPSHQVDL
jgi:hypothetical protein